MKRLLLVLALVGCGSNSNDAPPPQTQPTDTGTVIDQGPPPPGPGDPPLCMGEPSPGTPPSPRAGHAGIIDPTGKKLVIFGGDTHATPCGGTDSPTLVAETFVLDIGCGNWRAIGATGPAARSHHVMINDRRRDRALVFGGRTASAQLDDLWGFDFTTEAWTKLETSGAKPSGRSSASAVYDQKRDRVIVFGGNTDASGTAPAPVNETYALGSSSATGSRSG